MRLPVWVFALVALLFAFAALGADPYQFDKMPRYAKITASSTITTSSVLIVPENLKRVGMILYNNSGNSVYITFATSGNSFDTLAVLIPLNSQWVMPSPVYRGPISGIRNAGTGKVIATELQEAP